MARVFTSEELITEVRRIGAFNDVSSEGKTDTDILNALNTVILDELVPSLIKYQEDYLVKTVDQVITVATDKYAIPTRAVGNVLRDIYYLTADGQNQYLPLLNREDIPFYNTIDVQQPDGFHMEGDFIVIIPKSGGTIRISFYFRPGSLVKAADYRKVISVSSTTSVVIDSAAPTSWNPLTTLFDAHSKNSGAENRFFDFGAGISGITLTFNQLIDGSVDGTSAVEVGDYIVEAENAAVPGLPRDMHPILAQAAAARMLESEGDTEMLELAQRTLARQLKNMNHILEARVVGKPKKITNRNSFITRQISRGGW